MRPGPPTRSSNTWPRGAGIRTWAIGARSRPTAPCAPASSSHGVCLRMSRLPQTNCPAIELPATWEAYVAGLSRKRLYYVNSYPRKFLRKHNAEVIIRSAASDVDRGIATFYRLHFARWATKSDEISADHRDPDFAAFLAKLGARF